MSKKNVIEIPAPAGYEQCQPIEATHVLLDGWVVDKIIGGHDEYKLVRETHPPFQPRYINEYGPRITAWLRAVPKPEPFRVVFDATIARFKTYEVDNHGMTYDAVKSYCVELPGGVGPYAEHTKVRVTLVEVKE